MAEKGVFFVPGSCFDKEYYFRLGLAQDSKLFKAGLDELSNFVDEHLISCLNNLRKGEYLCEFNICCVHVYCFVAVQK